MLKVHLYKIIGIGIITFVMSLTLFAVNNKIVEDTSFKDGDRVAFIGNSITHVGLWHLYIQAYYQTRFPERNIQFINCGIGGNVASDVLERMGSDILPHKPTVAVIKLGMNDSGNSFYETKYSDKELLMEQNRIVNKYKKEMREIIQQLQNACNPRIILIKPTPYDANYKGANRIALIGKNETIKKLTIAIDELAKEFDFAVVDFYNPLNKLNIVQQKKDSNFTAIGKDRVHPGSMGHLMMAYLFIKSQMVSNTVSTTEINLLKPQKSKTINASLSGLIRKNDSISFRIIEHSLPFPISSDALGALQYMPVNEINEQKLSVKGLGRGTYKLKIENKEMGQFSTCALRKGINIATNDNSPQMKQAQEVLRVLKKSFDKNVNLRDMLAAQKQFERANVNMYDSAKVSSFVEKKRNENAYYGRILQYYLKNKSNIEAIKKAIQLDLNEAMSISRPLKRDYVLTKVSFLK